MIENQSSDFQNVKKNVDRWCLFIVYPGYNASLNFKIMNYQLERSLLQTVLAVLGRFCNLSLMYSAIIACVPLFLHSHERNSGAGISSTEPSSYENFSSLSFSLSTAGEERSSVPSTVVYYG